MKIELKNNITQDRYTKYICDSFDIQDNKESKVVVEANLDNIPKDFNIGVVYGGSGSGKTTILKHYFKKNIDESYFDNTKSLISNFDWLEPDEATMLLSSMGLSSVPTWLRPFNVLSNGEQYRANLAYIVGKAKEGEVILIDEYTSVVDRDVAKAMSNALQKYIRRNNKKIVLASCHFDIMDWLQPDWIYSPQKGRLEIATSRRQRPRIELQILRCRYETWNLFKQHHYLTEDLNKASKNFITLYNDKPVCFVAILPMPSGTIQNAYRISRIVVLPDFQGLGIGIKLLNYFGSMYKKDHKSLYIKTSNPSLFNGMSRNVHNWKLSNENNNIEQIKRNNQSLIEKEKSGEIKFNTGIKLIKESVTKSYKYIGEETNDNINIIKFKSEVYKDIAQNQISIFDIINK
jgi:ABC-type lipoprotein export system ATPase subunit/N-acetylglutamate synthase-like GNAT family acetyltransferase